MARYIRASLATCLVAALLLTVQGSVLGRAVSPALAPTTNTSLVLYKPPANGKPGRAVTGTLVNGVFTKKGAFNARRWTSIAVGRDSMALYDKGTGKLLTGKFRNGVWKPVKSRTIAKGYTHVVASCDSILFYKRSTGTGKTAEFTSGDIRDMRRFPTQSDDLPLLAASCDTLMAHGNDVIDDGHVGLLRDGYYRLSQTFAASGWKLLTADRTSFARLVVPDFGATSLNYGILRDGSRTSIGSATVDTWQAIAGVGDAILFYARSTGAAHAWRLEDGVPADTGPVSGLGKGWRVIAGGK